MLSKPDISRRVCVAALTCHPHRATARCATQALVVFSAIVIPILVLLTLIASAVGVATMIMAVIHGKQWSDTSRYASVASNLVTFGLVRTTST
jgi:AWPM-19-like family